MLTNEELRELTEKWVNLQPVRHPAHALLAHITEQQQAIEKLREALGPFYLHQRALEPGLEWWAFSTHAVYSEGKSHLTWCAFLQAKEAIAETAAFAGKGE